MNTFRLWKVLNLNSFISCVIKLLNFWHWFNREFSTSMFDFLQLSTTFFSSCSNNPIAQVAQPLKLMWMGLLLLWIPVGHLSRWVKMTSVCNWSTAKEMLVWFVTNKQGFLGMSIEKQILAWQFLCFNQALGINPWNSEYICIDRCIEKHSISRRLNPVQFSLALELKEAWTQAKYYGIYLCYVKLILFPYVLCKRFLATVMRRDESTRSCSRYCTSRTVLSVCVCTYASLDPSQYSNVTFHLR